MWFAIALLLYALAGGLLVYATHLSQTKSQPGPDFNRDQLRGRRSPEAEVTQTSVNPAVFAAELGSASDLFLDRQLLSAKGKRQGRHVWLKKAKLSRFYLSSFSLLLRQAGLITLRSQSISVLSALVASLMVCVLVFMYEFTQEHSLAQQLGYTLIGMIITLLVFLYRIRAVRAKRTAKIDEQTITVVQLTQMLWSTGMTLESVLRLLVQSVYQIAPEIATELWIAYQRIRSGQDRVQVLDDLAEVQHSSAFASYLSLLAQVSTSGGGLAESLTEMEQTFSDARRIQLQEKVNTLSGKMSLVMMLFLFPALLILLAGPAVINLGIMLKGIGGAG